MFTDTHTHPYYADASNGIDFIRRAINAGVERLVIPNVDLDSIEPMKKLAQMFPDNVRMAMGLHPTEIKNDSDTENALSIILGELAYQEHPYVAVGEIGIDLYWDKTFRNEQMKIFDTQLNVAETRNLPVIIHCREGLSETLEVLENHKNLRAVFHSFGGNIEDVETILKKSDDFYFGINGIVTFKNSKLKSVIPAIPTNKILLETDAPYLTPVPHRGKPNESAYIPFIAAAIADALNKDIEVIADITNNNAARFFSWPLKN